MFIYKKRQQRVYKLTGNDISMQKDDTKGITVKKLQDMPEWYNQVILKAELADYSPIRGCMIIRPYGYAIWEKLQQYFDSRIQMHQVQNAYFPLFVPESFFTREAKHAQGFAPEVAWIEKKENETGERLAIRPTSETIMYDAYSRWIRSWRDLPLRINQWANVVRWEISDVKLFLRTREFLWQEGHCVYESQEECDKETRLFLEEYAKLCEEQLAIPVLKGVKTEKEKFAGADKTYAIEGLMPDGKGLQLGTSHNLGQNFAHAFNIKFIGKDEKEHIPWQNSWGISTRLIGGLVMMHGDDKGLVLPPNVAPLQVVIVPIIFDASKKEVLKVCQDVSKTLSIRHRLDDREEYSSGWKFNEWEKNGVPLRIEIGPKDVEKKTAVFVRRDTGDKRFVAIKDVQHEVILELDRIQRNLFDKAKKFLDSHITKVTSWSDFMTPIKRGNMVLANHCGSVECEQKIKEETIGVTTRVIPLENMKAFDKSCIKCGNKSMYQVYFARNY